MKREFLCLSLVYRLRWLREVGIIDRIHRRWIPRKPPCEGSLGFNSIGITEVKPALILWLVGFVSSLVVLCIECLLHRTVCKKHKNLKEQHGTKIFRITRRIRGTSAVSHGI